MKMNLSAKRIGSLLLSVCMVLTLLPLAAQTAWAVSPPDNVTVSTANELKDALESATPQNITVNSTLIQMNATTVGADHTLNIAAGQTIEIRANQMTIPQETTLTVNGPGEFLIQNISSPDIVALDGTLSLKSGLTFYINNGGSSGSSGLKIGSTGSLESENCTVKIENYASSYSGVIGIYSLGTIDIQGGSLLINTTCENSKGILSAGQMTLSDDCAITIKNDKANSVGIDALVGSISIKNSSLSIENTVSSGQNNGISFSVGAVIENSTVVLKNKNSTNAFHHIGDAALTFNNCTITADTSSTGHYAMSGGGLVRYENSTITVPSGKAMINALDSVEATGASKIILAEGAELQGYPMQDRGTPLTSPDKIIVRSADALASPTGLSAGTYTWDGTAYFSKSEGISWTGLTANGTPNIVNTTELTLTFDQDPGNLSVNNITVTGAQKGTLTGTGTERKLTISNITVAEGANVTVALTHPAGTPFTPASKTVAVHKNTALGVPDGTWDGATPGKATWTAIDNASSYSVQLYKGGNALGSPVTDLTQTYHDFTSAIMTAGAGSYTFAVRAVGDGVFWSDSPLSAVSGEYTYAPTPVTGTMNIGGTSNVSLNDGAKSGTGWAWNADSATLTLGSGYQSGNRIEINCQPSDTVNLVYSGDVTITSAAASTIYCSGNLNITGSGELAVDYTGDGDFCALEIYGGLKITGGGLNASSSGNTGELIAVVIYGEQGVEISGNANVTATATGTNADGIQTDIANNITISTTGTVTANGTGTRYAVHAGDNGFSISSGTVNLSNSDTPANLFYGNLIHDGGTLNGENPPNSPIVTRVMVTFTAVTLAREETWQFKASVFGINNPERTVTWSVSGQSSASTVITDSGLLTVGEDETSASLTVTATSTFDETKSVTCPVIVSNPASGGGTAPAITTTLSNTYVGDSTYICPWEASGTAPFAWSLESGTLPPGMNFHESGIDGTPTTEGTYTFTIKVTNAFGSDTKEFTIRVYPTGTTFYTVTFALNGGTRTGGGELTQSVPSGGSAVAPDVTRSNYTFTGWDKAFTNVTSNLTVTASWSYDGGGGNGGGGGGSYTPSTPATTTPEKKPDQPVTAAAPVTATAGANGAASAAIPEKSVTDAVTKAQADAKAQGSTANGISVELNVTMPQGATSLTATLTQNSLNSLVSAGVTSLELSGSPVSLGLDLNALQEIQKQSGGNVAISFTPATGLSSEAKALMGNRPVYNITISTVNDGKTVNITSLGSGTATLSIPYTPASGEAVGYLFGVYVDGAGNPVRIDGSAYDANAGGLLIPTGHFSVYGVGYTAPSAKFTDISTHWGKESIDYVVGRELLSGTSETAFAPDTAMTRGMLVTALGRLANVDTKAYTTNSFTDVKADSVFSPYIEWARSKGIIQGIGNGQFAPDRAVTREEIAVIFANFAKATGYTLPVTREAATYADASGIGSAYKAAVTAMQQAGIMMGGSGNKFNPKSSATRAEVSAMLHRYIKLTIDPATAQGWAKNNAGQWLYYKNGKAFTGTQTIDGVKYFFETTGVLKTGWVKDGENWLYYSGNTLLIGWWDIGANGDNKRYYFDTYGNMISGKWLQIDGKWYYFYADGSLAVSAKIDEYEVDENGVKKTK